MSAKSGEIDQIETGIRIIFDDQIDVTRRRGLFACNRAIKRSDAAGAQGALVGLEQTGDIVDGRGRSIIQTV